ncbi:phage portal protein [Klenkia sp. LSe6-5]|uniref:Phage portal protein n=1 Tax=Klenkia sesuvii TaxID=3103137 RepID=A0ABU8E1G1_9ACTN
MTWLSSLLGGAESRASVENPQVPLTSASLADLFVGPKGDAGVAVTPKTAFSMPAVYRAVALLAGTSASLPLYAYRDGANGVRERLGYRPGIIDRPHPDLTRFEWLELSFVHALAWGNTFYLKVRDGTGIVRELWPLVPNRVRAGRATDDGRKIYALDTRNWGGGQPGGTFPLDEATALTDYEILHVPGMGFDGVVGMSPIECAKQGIGMALAAEQFGAKLFSSGNLMSGILKSESKLTPAQADMVKAQWKAKHSGLNAAHDIAVMGSGVSFEQVSFPPADVQFIESRRFQIDEVARMYGIPPHMLFQTDRSTSWGSGIEQQTIGLVVFTLRPWLTRFEQRLSRLLPSPQYLSFVVEGLLRGDSAARAAFYKAMWELGVYSTNDIRRLEDQAPVDGGDIRYRPLNFGVLGESDNAIKGRVEAASALIRSGFAPAAVIEAVGLDPIEHLGLLPVTVQRPAEPDNPDDAVVDKLEEDNADA